MPYTDNSSTVKFMMNAKKVLNSLENTPAAMNRLQRYGLTAEKLQEGRDLAQQAAQANLEYAELLIEQKRLGKQFNEEWKQLASLHQVHLNAARRCLASELDQLLGPRSHSYDEWVGQVQRFYAVILNKPAHLEKLNAMSVPTEALVRADQWLTTLIANKSEQTQGKTNVRLLHGERDRKLQEFKTWFDVILSTARSAFRDQPVLRQLVSARPTNSQNETKVLPAEAAVEVVQVGVMG